MRIDFSPLEKALTSLNRALVRALAAPEDEELRDACIQRFEYTFELCWKMLRRYLEVTLPNPEEVDGMSFQTLIRTGSEQGLLLNGWDRWVNYRKARGTSSHVYDGEKAREVFGVVPEFLLEAKYLLGKLTEKMPRP